MKRFLIVIFCFALTIKAKAQADKVILDNVFQHINKSTIPTGYLQDYGAAFVNKESYNGNLTDSNAIANLSAFRLMYNDLLSAKINPSATSMPNISAINSILEPLQGSTATPLIFNISSYAGFEPDALLDGKVTFTNNQFFPVAGQNPWVTHRFFAACPIDAVSPTTNSLTLTYNSSLVFSNCGKQISNVSINFYDGAGYQALANGGTLTQTYTDSSGYKPFAIKVVCTDGSVYECYSLQYVHVTTGVGARYAIGNILPLAQNVNFFNTAPTPKRGTMQVVYSSKRPSGHPQYQKIIKPLIIINGLDETDIDPNTPAALKKNLRKLLDAWEFDIIGYDFNSQLDDLAGYDLIYINYYTLDKIEHNADMLISMLNWINANKAVGAEQNVVMGIELGGLVSRYALAKMTRANQPTGTRLLITHDAPHQGAYMPLGYQHLAEDFGEMDFWGTPFRQMISEFKTRQALKNSPVFEQFYLHKVDGATVTYNSFLSPNAAYHTMVDFPVGGPITPTYQFVATSQGSQCGTNVTTPGITMLDYEQKIDDDPAALIPNIPLGELCLDFLCFNKIKFTLGFCISYKIKLKVNTLPNFGINKSISYAAMTREIYLKIKTKVCTGYGSYCVTLNFLTIKIGTGALYSQGPFERINPTNILPYESVAGGTNSLKDINFRLVAINGTFITLGGWFNVIYPTSQFFDVSFQNPTYSYISRVSALDIENPTLADYTQPLIQPLNGLNRSRAAKYVCQEVSNNGGAALYNLASTRFTKRNASWMYKIMENEPTLTEDCLGYTACYNTNSFAISGEDVVCSSKPFNITNFPAAASIAWSVNPSNMASFSPSNTPSTTLSLNNNGGAYLFASC